jgi:hypothetical protein
MNHQALLAALALALCGPAFAAGNHAHDHNPCTAASSPKWPTWTTNSSPSPTP